MDGGQGNSAREMEGETKRRNGHIEFKTREMQIGKGKTERPTKTDRLEKTENEETDGGDRSTALLSEDDRVTGTQSCGQTCLANWGDRDKTDKTEQK